MFLIFSTIDVQFSVEQCFSVYRLSTFFVLLCVFGNGNVKVRRRSSLAVASELRGQGVHCTPQVQDLYPLYPQVKDAAYVKF